MSWIILSSKMIWKATIWLFWVCLFKIRRCHSTSYFLWGSMVVRYKHITTRFFVHGTTLTRVSLFMQWGGRSMPIQTAMRCMQTAKLVTVCRVSHYVEQECRIFLWLEDGRQCRCQLKWIVCPKLDAMYTKKKGYRWRMMEWWKVSRVLLLKPNYLTGFKRQFPYRIDWFTFLVWCSFFFFLYLSFHIFWGTCKQLFNGNTMRYRGVDRAPSP